MLPLICDEEPQCKKCKSLETLSTKKVGGKTTKIREDLVVLSPLSMRSVPPCLPTPCIVCPSLGWPALPVWHLCKSQRREPPRRVVLFCLWEPSCAMLLCPGPEPSPIVCCHMEVSRNTEISLSSCCSLTFSGTQLALNGKIYNYPRYPCWLCLVIVCWGLREGGRGWLGAGEWGVWVEFGVLFQKSRGGYCGGRSPNKRGALRDGLMLPDTLCNSLLLLSRVHKSYE